MCIFDHYDVVEFGRMSKRRKKSAMDDYNYVRTKMDFQSRLSPETIPALIGIHFNSLEKCCVESDFEAGFLDKAKSSVLTRGI